MRSNDFIIIHYVSPLLGDAASILDLEGEDTLTVDEINTSSKLVCRDGKDGENACRPSLG
jgi:hypothetical protein